MIKGFFIIAFFALLIISLFIIAGAVIMFIWNLFAHWFGFKEINLLIGVAIFGTLTWIAQLFKNDKKH
jgi:hypothetical protein